MENLNNYIAGELVPPRQGNYLPNFAPATAEVYSYAPDSTSEDVDRAVEAAQNVFPAWARLSTFERARVLRKIGELISSRGEELARAEAQDTGKPFLAALQVDIARSSQNFVFFSEAIGQFASEFHATDQSTINYTLRAPVGVVGCISPWNLPLYLLTWKIAPALAAGNTVVAKPSEITPMTAFLLSQICIEAGLPPGVLNIVHGTGSNVGVPLVQHPHVHAISFTGSTKTGAEIIRLAAPTFKKVSLEMGGKNPTLVFADADFEAAVTSTLRAAYSNQGQICLCGSRIYVERSLYQRFKEALTARIMKLKVGDPFDQDVDQGAVVSQAHFEKILASVEMAKREGGRILCGGSRVIVKGRCEKGWFIAPTLIENLDIQCRTNQDEIFGPVATITPFDDEEDALSLANNSRYGLSASVWTNELSRAHRVASKIQVGMVWINCWMVRDLRTPFGGVKHSGVGREGGLDALRFFTEPKNVCVRL